MRFPKTESEIRALAQNIISGLANNPKSASPAALLNAAKCTAG